MSAASNSIIIYRSRAEAEIDRMIWDGDGSSIAIFGYVLAMLVMFVFIYSMLDKFVPNKYNRGSLFLWVSAILAAPLGYAFGQLFGTLLLWI